MLQLSERGAAESLVAKARERFGHGELPAKIFNHPELHALEMERIFAKAWVFLGHESEIPNPGDFVRRSIAEDEFIVVRDASRFQPTKRPG